jgi:hypothetical protein
MDKNPLRALQVVKRQRVAEPNKRPEGRRDPNLSPGDLVDRFESVALLCHGERRDKPASVKRGDLLGRLRSSGLDGLGDQGLAQFG